VLRLVSRLARRKRADKRKKGVGVIIAGVVEEKTADIVIGILQLLVPFLGWLWAVIWGILMMIRSC
jgi:hypothetical protein